MRKVAVVLAFMLLAASAVVVSIVAAQQDQVAVTMNAQNDSGQDGTATLTDIGNSQTQVTIDIAPGDAGVIQPAHIHSGSCANLGGILYPLTDVVDGKSTTTVNASLNTLQDGNMAVNVHMSASEIGTYVSCGDIPVAAAQVSPTATATTAVTETPTGTVSPTETVSPTPTEPLGGAAETATATATETPTGTPGVQVGAATPAPTTAPTGLPSAGDDNLSIIVMVTAIVGVLALGIGLIAARRRF